MVYLVIVRARRHCYRRGWLRTAAAPVPVIVVGNITVGGSGKTPMVIWLARHLCSRGLHPGVISRGYGRHHPEASLPVTADSDPAAVGDEPLLIARRTGCPVLVSRDRVQAARRLAGQWQCDIVISDDGMQHYRLHRDLEICMVDKALGLGNGRCLPAGPLREPPSRLREADLLLGPEGPGHLPGHSMTLKAGRLRNLARAGPDTPLSSWAGRTVHATAGIARPERFFTLLEAHGLRLIRHPFPDHHPYRAGDIDFPGPLPIVMTEKDAVKCAPFCTARHWRLPVCARPSETFVHCLDELLAARLGAGR